MLTILKRYNTSRYISLHYATGPKVLHEGMRSYFFFFFLKWPE